MPDNNDIKRKDVEVPELGKMSVPEDFNLEKAQGATYDSLDDFIEDHKSESFWKKITLTWQGKTDVGRLVGTGLDIAELFAPKWAVKTRALLQSQTKPKPMLQDKKWYQSKTIWSAILLLVTAVLQALGVDLMSNPELTATVYQVAMMLAGAFGLYGLRDAIGKQKRKYEDK